MTPNQVPHRYRTIDGDRSANTTFLIARRGNY